MDMDTEYAYSVSPREETRAPEWIRRRHAPGSTPIGLRHGVELLRVGAGPLAPVEPGQGRHRRLVELEVEQREVLLHALALDRLREDDVAALDVPAQRHLGRR